METLMHADAFFFIASIGFIILLILLSVALTYLILILRRWYRITCTVDEQIASVGEEMKEIVRMVKESRLLGWLFKKKKSK